MTLPALALLLGTLTRATVANSTYNSPYLIYDDDLKCNEKSEIKGIDTGDASILYRHNPCQCGDEIVAISRATQEKLDNDARDVADGLESSIDADTRRMYKMHVRRGEDVHPWQNCGTFEYLEVKYHFQDQLVEVGHVAEFYAYVKYDEKNPFSKTLLINLEDHVSKYVVNVCICDLTTTLANGDYFCQSREMPKELFGHENPFMGVVWCDYDYRLTTGKSMYILIQFTETSRRLDQTGIYLTVNYTILTKAHLYMNIRPPAPPPTDAPTTPFEKPTTQAVLQAAGPPEYDFDYFEEMDRKEEEATTVAPTTIAGAEGTALEVNGTAPEMETTKHTQTRVRAAVTAAIEADASSATRVRSGAGAILVAFVVVTVQHLL